MKSQDLAATDGAKAVAIEVLGRSRTRPNFGNGGEVENLLGQAKARHQTRQASLPLKDRSLDIIFEPQDFDINFDRNAHASDNLQKLFEDVIGCEEIVAKLEGYQRICRAMKARGMDMRKQIPTNFIFKGPPGKFTPLSNCSSSLTSNLFHFPRNRKDHNRAKNRASVLRHGLFVFDGGSGVFGNRSYWPICRSNRPEDEEAVGKGAWESSDRR